MHQLLHFYSLCCPLLSFTLVFFSCFFFQILAAHSLGGLRQIWVKIEAATDTERSLIRDFDNLFQDAETERCKRVCTPLLYNTY